MGLGKDGEGGEERGPVVGPLGQRIGLAIGYFPPVDDVVVVGREGGRRYLLYGAARRLHRHLG